jgi:hypothetical protein
MASFVFKWNYIGCVLCVQYICGTEKEAFQCHCCIALSAKVKIEVTYMSLAIIVVGAQVCKVVEVSMY